MKIIRLASCVATPWKNGGGVTREVIRSPALGSGSFAWRLSVADLEVSGPFSDFTGYRRLMVLLAGGGVRLTFGDGTGTRLLAVGEMARFDGGLATGCELLSGPCTDLNLMVSNTLPEARAWVERLDTDCTDTVCPDTSRPAGATLVFAVEGAVAVTAGGATATLEPWDCALAPLHTAMTVKPAGRPGDRPPLVFFASLDDNSVPSA
jgi:hypothetical protein